jgi:dolichyl-diphosphooligosaccharide--protein glycosyltransferase
LATRPAIAEGRSILSGDSLGWLLLFGFVLVVAVPTLAWASHRAYLGGRTLLVPAVYCWYFFVLAVLQVRFAGQLAMFAAVFAGLGFVYLASVVDVVDPPAFESRRVVPVSLSIPDRQTVAYLVVLLVLVAGLSAVQVPVKISQITTDGGDYRAAAWMQDHAAERGLEYPGNYVLSPWGENRMYNYFVNGRSDSYVYAQNNYDRFLQSTEPERWYERLRDRVGFVVVDLHGADPETLQSRLSSGFGSRQSGAPGLEHYRARYVSPGGEPAVFTLVPGGTFTGTAQPNETITVSTDVDLPGASFTYERSVQTTMDGRYAVTAPYPGTYVVGENTHRLTDDDVRSGGFVGDRGTPAHWSFEAGRGEVAYDRRGGNHGRINGSRWTSGVRGRGLAFDGDGSVEVPRAGTLDWSNGGSLSVWFRTDEAIDYREDRQYPRIAARAASSPYRSTDGYQIALRRGQIAGVLGEGEGATRLFGPRVDDGEWHHAVLTWNGTVVRLFLDGRQVTSGSFEGDPANANPFAIGSASDGDQRFIGRVDEIRVSDDPLTPDEVRDRYEATTNETS